MGKCKECGKEMDSLGEFCCQGCEERFHERRIQQEERSRKEWMQKNRRKYEKKAEKYRKKEDKRHEKALDAIRDLEAAIKGDSPKELRKADKVAAKRVGRGISWGCLLWIIALIILILGSLNDIDKSGTSDSSISGGVSNEVSTQETSSSAAEITNQPSDSQEAKKSEQPSGEGASAYGL